MNRSEVIDEQVNDASAVRIRINCEFLHNCAFHCPGCYVYRKNSYDDHQLEILSQAVSLFRTNGMTFDEIIIGPTDFFAATNTKDLLAEPLFNKIFENGDVVLTFPTTLQSTDEHILATIDVVNNYLTHPDMEVEILIVPELSRIMAKDLEYAEVLRQKIQLLNTINAKVDYAIQMNIMEVGKLPGDFNLSSITTFVRDQFDTIVEFNPSFFRTRKEKLVESTLAAWNDMLRQNITPENKESVTFTMANMYHAGYNEITYNFHEGDLYMCPFIYENVFDRSESFKVPKSQGAFYVWADIIDHDATAKGVQYEYMSHTTECDACPYVASCVAKHVLFYMQQYHIQDCMIAKDIVDYYT